MARQSLAAGTLLALLLGCGHAAREPSTARTELEPLLPEASSLVGWTIAEGPVEYSADALWEYLDGAAPRYMAYGFRKLVHVRYQLGDDSLAGVTLDLFDMGSELGAFGLYRNALPEAAALRPWGTEGHQSGTVAAAWKGPLYVHSEADDDRPALIGLLGPLVAEVCDAYPGESALPTILDLLPPAGRVPRSERYVAHDLHGFAFLPGGILATYERDGRRAQLYFSDLQSESAARAALARLRQQQSEWGATLAESRERFPGGFRFSHPSLGSGSAVVVGPFVAGVHGDLAADSRDDLLEQLVKRLKTSGR